MSLGDFKLYAINTTTLGITTFAEIEMGLKLLLLVVTIGYTINKWMQLKKEKIMNCIFCFNCGLC